MLDDVRSLSFAQGDFIGTIGHLADQSGQGRRDEVVMLRGDGQFQRRRFVFAGETTAHGVGLLDEEPGV